MSSGGQAAFLEDLAIMRDVCGGVFDEPSQFLGLVVQNAFRRPAVALEDSGDSLFVDPAVALTVVLPTANGRSQVAERRHGPDNAFPAIPLLA